MKTRLFLLLIALSMTTLSCLGQTTSLTGTVTDADGNTWNNATWTYNLVNPTGGPTKNVCSGVSPVPVQYSGTLSSSGVFSGAVDSTNCISPGNTTWQLTIQSKTSAPPVTLTQQPISGASYNAGAFASGLIPVPRFQAIFNSIGYADVEAATPFEGNSYLNVVTGNQRVYHNGAWANIGGSAGAGCGANATDATSTDCGTGNNAGTTITAPADFTTYGNANNTNSAITQFGAFFGNGNGINGNSNTNNAGAFGYNNFKFPGGSFIWGFGANNSQLNAGVTGNCASSNGVFFGTANDFPCSETFSQFNYYVGDNNFNNPVTSGVHNHVQMSGNIAFGANNFNYSAANTTSTTNSNNIALGQFNLANLANSAGNIAIGNTNMGGTVPPITTGINNNIAMGNVCLDFIADGAHDNICLGNGALNNGSTSHVSGNQNIAEGINALQDNTTGSSNIGIGPNAGLNNSTGSSNLWLGSGSGPSTTAINPTGSTALGLNAHNTTSNEFVLGASNILHHHLFMGCATGLVPTGDGNDTCVSPGAATCNFAPSAVTCSSGTVTGTYTCTTAGKIEWHFISTPGVGTVYTCTIPTAFPAGCLDAFATTSSAGGSGTLFDSSGAGCASSSTVSVQVSQSSISVAVQVNGH